jgi:RimJ/RimL family protein N-acetyltransferase
MSYRQAIIRAVYTIGAVESADTAAAAAPPHEAEPLVVTGPALTLRYATADDAPRLLELASDAAVTQWFSWGPYSAVDQPEAYIAGLPEKRLRGELLDFLVVHPEHGPVGVTGLSELAPRDRRATVGSWFGQAYWGTGVNRESKALIAALAFRRLNLDRLTAWANTRNGRSQVALERVGFEREGVLRSWHRHGDTLHDVVVFGMTRPQWEASPLAEVPVQISGEPPPAFLAG